MAKVGRPFLNASRRRVETIGNESKTMSTTTGDASPQGGSAGTSLESGETYIITSAATSARTFTLPPASKGAWVKIIWGVGTTANTSWKVVSQAGEYLVGQVFHFDSGPDGDRGSDNIVAAAGNMTGGTDNDLSITYNDDILSGTYITFISDGTFWYSMENQSMGDETHVTVASS